MPVSWDMSRNRLGYSYRQRMILSIILKINNNNKDHKEMKKIALADPPDSKRGDSCLKTDLDYLFMTAGNYR